MGYEFVMLSLPPMLIGTLAAMACALPGNFLLLRRQSLIGDAISHVVLPGIVVAFLLTGVVSAVPMMLGAAGAALVAVLAIEAVRRLGRGEPGAAMGVVFTAMFAGGVLLLEQSDTSAVHLDVEHALYGNLESLIWIDANGWASLLDPVALAGLPPELLRMAVVLVAVALTVALCWRWLKIATFDEGFASALGLPVRLIGLGVVVMAALAAGGGLRRGGLYHRDRHVHLPPRRGAHDDQPAGAADPLVHGFCRGLGCAGLRAGGLRTAVAGGGGFGLCRRDDRGGLWRPAGAGGGLRTAPARVRTVSGRWRDPTGAPLRGAVRAQDPGRAERSREPRWGLCPRPCGTPPRYFQDQRRARRGFWRRAFRGTRKRTKSEI